MNDSNISHYRLIERIGSGGMGEVYKAHDTILDRTVAIKILPAAVVGDEDRIRRFVQEAKAASALNHPSILTIHEIGEFNGKHFIAMEYVDGETLRGRLDKGPLEMGRLLEIATQTAEALAAAHSAGIVHRDVKPENIMVRRDGFAKLLDFGLAQLSERHMEGSMPPDSSNSRDAATVILPPEVSMASSTAAGASAATQPGVVMGTVGYMSPEQVRGQIVDHRSDLFAFGCVLYEMVCGRRPFEAGSPIEVMHKILTEQPHAVRELNQTTPVELQRIIRRAMAKDVEQRYQSAKDLAIDLKELKREVDSGAVSAAWPAISGSSASVPGIGGRTRNPWFMVGAVMLAALAVGLYTLTGNRTTNAQQLKVTRISSTGRSFAPAISPDRKYVAHVSTEDGRNSIWVKQLATSSMVQLIPPTEDKLGHLTFSPDGNWLLYEAIPKGGVINTLWQVPTLGGPPRKMLDDVDSTVSFSPNGKEFVFVRQNGYLESKVLAVPADGSGEARIVASNKDGFFFSPSWSPDGKQIALALLEKTNPLVTWIGHMDVGGGSFKAIGKNGWATTEHLVWAPDGSGIYANARRTLEEPLQLWLISHSNGEAKQITSDLSDYLGICVSGDGEALLSAKSTRSPNLWRIPLPASANQAERAALQITTGTAVVEHPSLSPDGERIVYASDAGGNFDIWVMDAAGGNSRQLTFDSSMDGFAEWSPDGKHVAFLSNRSGSFQVWLMDPEGSNAHQLTRGSLAFAPSWSPDSKWIAYSAIESGRQEIWKIPAGGGTPVQLTIASSRSISPSWSPDGKSLLCWLLPDAAPYHPKVAIIPAEGGPAYKTLDAPYTRLVHWSPDGKAINYAQVDGGNANLMSLSLEGGPAVPIANLGKDQAVFSFDLSKDGRYLYCARGNGDERRIHDRKLPLMTEIFDYLTRHGYLLIFGIVFLEGIGFPIPTAPILLAAGAMSALGFFGIWWVMALGVAAMVLGDSVMYALGRRTGWYILGVLCRLSLNPESCVVRSADAFYRRGRLTLLFSKFLPGINTMAPPLAGSLRMRFPQFLGLDLLASLIYIVPFSLLGYLFSEQISRIVLGLASVNRVVGWLFFGALVLYVVYRIRVMLKDRNYHGVPRARVEQLRQRLEEDGDAILIADVRSHGYFDPGAKRIKHSIHLDPANIVQILKDLPRDKEIYLYCT